MKSSLLLLSLVAIASGATGSCPYLSMKKDVNLELIDNPHRRFENDEFHIALKELPLEKVKEDIIDLMHKSQDWWPADFGNYGPFFVRLAWHCSGSYRTSDGRGGCDGGRQRFEPEESWDDNTNLDKARQLLWPIKEKYGMGLSWGDLFILAGTTAIEDMGGPVLGFCAGRQDDADGSASLPLGPSSEQELLAPCEVNGQCEEPLGTTTVGLIYVNPEGPMGQPVPEDSAPQVRDTFSRMGMNDTETVALIGGGHAFGKAHGACPDGAGPSPAQDPLNPWPGNCGTGSGNDTFTSGFEGAWTTTPTQWGSSYFHNLLDYEWGVVTGPGGHYQWRPKTTSAQPNPPDIMMLTSDVSLISDEAYLEIVKQFAANQAEFERQFAAAWYKLTSRDMGPATRCIGSNVPDPQPFQYPLPPPVPEDELPDFNAVKKDIEAVMRAPFDSVLAQDEGGSYGPFFVRLAWQCASTHRQTDYLGGCNGARIRFSPEKDWPANAALDKALLLLNPVKLKYGSSLSWADLIVLAGTTALEDAGRHARLTVPFQGGRSDAVEGEGLPTPDFLESRLTGGEPDDTVDEMRDAMTVLGLSNSEVVALVGGGHSLGRMHFDRTGFLDGSWTTQPLKLDNEYFKNLLDLNWTEITGADAEHIEYSAQEPETGKTLYMLKTDMNIRADPEYKAVAQSFAESELLFHANFAAAWYKVMTADRY